MLHFFCSFLWLFLIFFLIGLPLHFLDFAYLIAFFILHKYDFLYPGSQEVLINLYYIHKVSLLKGTVLGDVLYRFGRNFSRGSFNNTEISV